MLVDTGKEKTGWDTSLARPFRDLQDVPVVFHRTINHLTFAARDHEGLHIIYAHEDDSIEFVSDHDGVGSDRYRHAFTFSTWPGSLSLRKALARLNTKLIDAYHADQDTVEISDFVTFMRELPHRVALVGYEQSVEPTVAQWLAFDTIVEARGQRNKGWFLALGEPVTIGWHDGTGVDYRNVLCVGQDLPYPLDNLTPTYEVIIDDEDRRCGIHPALLRIEEPRPNVVEEMKAYRHLSDDMMSQLREFATHGSGWVGQW